jgi:methyltransferase
VEPFPGAWTAYVILAFVAAQRLAELWLANRNTRALLAAGGEEHGAGHYPLFVLLHGGWLIAMAGAVSGDTLVHWPLIALFLLLQLGRLWVIRSLGRYWTTRVISVPDAPLVSRGPYRWLRHPNYLVVALEIPTLPLAFGFWWIAAVFGVLNLLLLGYRIRFEDRVLAVRRGGRTGG